MTAINFKILGYKDISKEELTFVNQILSKLFTLADTHLKGRKFFVGQSITIADLNIYATLVYAYRSYFDKNFRRAHSGLTAWFESVA
jgi:elongation factor 1-gamma